jgi:hypothetical protein
MEIEGVVVPEQNSLGKKSNLNRKVGTAAESCEFARRAGRGVICFGPFADDVMEY